MGINVESRDERGKPIEWLDGNLDEVVGLLFSQSSVWFDHIDQWGDTTYNPSQCREFVRELRRVLDSVDVSRSQRITLENLLRLASTVASTSHRYLVFVGD